MCEAKDPNKITAIPCDSCTFWGSLSIEHRVKVDMRRHSLGVWVISQPPNARSCLPLFERRMRRSGVSMSLAMIAGDDRREFTVAVGTNPRTRQPLTPADTMLFGSGTKTFVGARVMQLVQSAHLRMDEPVGPHIDPMIRAWGQAHNHSASLSWVGLFKNSQDRQWAARVTVGMCIKMQSGLADWDQKGAAGLDDALIHSLAHTPNRLWSPIDFLNFTASKQPSFWFEPGTKTAYTDTSYQVVGLVIAAVEARLQGDRRGGGVVSWEDLDLRRVFGSTAATRYPHTNFCERSSCTHDRLAAASC